MARKPKIHVIQFDAAKFLHVFGKELKKVNQEIRDELWDAIKDNMRNLPFKKNEVRMTMGSDTSDWERRTALFNSMVDTRADWLTESYLRSTIRAMAKNFKQSHIGLYYEYGTGEKQEAGSTYESLGQPNLPFRVPNTGAPIVTRSRKMGMGGAWTDVGGNLRITDSPRAGEPVKKDGKKAARFRKYIGDDVQAAHWFSNAVNNSYWKKRIDKLFGTAIEEKIQPQMQSFFIHANGTRKFTLGKD